MGYYTAYEFTIMGYNSERDEKIHAFLDANEDAFYGIWPNAEEPCKCKWYDHDKEMKRLSLEFPGTLFLLTGNGEEQGDQWKKYYRDGKVHECRAIVSFEPFDESKLA